MSAREYIEAYEFMTDKQKDIMADLYMESVNFDCHAWAEESQVRLALNDLFSNMRTEESPIISELFSNIKNYEGKTCVTYGAIEKAVGLIVLGRQKNGRKPDKNL